jgi:hypothetical protein
MERQEFVTVHDERVGAIDSVCPRSPASPRKVGDAE